MPDGRELQELHVQNELQLNTEWGEFMASSPYKIPEPPAHFIWHRGSWNELFRTDGRPWSWRFFEEFDKQADFLTRSLDEDLMYNRIDFATFQTLWVEIRDYIQTSRMVFEIYYLPKPPSGYIWIRDPGRRFTLRWYKDGHKYQAFIMNYVLYDRVYTCPKPAAAA